jgi:hypothetical protein
MILPMQIRVPGPEASGSFYNNSPAVANGAGACMLADLRQQLAECEPQFPRKDSPSPASLIASVPCYCPPLEVGKPRPDDGSGIKEQLMEIDAIRSAITAGKAWIFDKRYLYLNQRKAKLHDQVARAPA